MSNETERLREQLQSERYQRAEQDLERELIARDTPPDEAARHARLSRDRIEVADNGDITTRTRRGGVYTGAQAIPELARQIRMDIVRDLPVDAATQDRILQQKRALARGIL